MFTDSYLRISSINSYVKYWTGLHKSPSAVREMRTIEQQSTEFVPTVGEQQLSVLKKRQWLCLIFKIFYLSVNNYLLIISLTTYFNPDFNQAKSALLRKKKKKMCKWLIILDGILTFCIFLFELVVVYIFSFIDIHYHVSVLLSDIIWSYISSCMFLFSIPFRCCSGFNSGLLGFKCTDWSLAQGWVSNLLRVPLTVSPPQLSLS